MSKLVLLLGLALVSAIGHAEDAEIANVVVTSVGEEAGTPIENPSCRLIQAVAPRGIDWSTLVQTGERVWKIIEAGRPVVSYVSPPLANVLPRGIDCWTDLSSWKPPKAYIYEVSYKNGFGMEVVKFRIRLQFTYGGGKGGYLANVSLQPEEISVIWGYDFNARVEAGQAVNLGTKAQPIAGIELNVQWNVKTIVKQSRSSIRFFVRGDGQALQQPR